MSALADSAPLGPLEALILGIVEGITEYLPVSSTGHLILTQRLLGIGNDPASRTFAICIQGGAILAVLGLYWPRVRSMLRLEAQGLHLARNLLIAFAPAVVAALLLEDFIDAHLFGLVPVVCAWLVGGVVMLGWKRLRDGNPGGGGLETMGWRIALVIGLFQCLALLPGTSRSFATIAGGLLLGLSGAAAVEFSLLLGVLTLSAATAKKALDGGAGMLEQFGAAPVAIGFLAGGVSAFLAVRWLVAWLQQRGLAPFGWYRVILALVVAVLLWQGVLDAS